MKYTSSILTSVLIVCYGLSYGQDKQLIKTKISDQTLLLPDNVLTWIKTPYDFPQNNLTIEEIDKKIDSIILSQRNKPVEEIQTPINLKKLKYYTYYDFKQFGIIGDNSHFTDKDSAYYIDAGGQRQIFQYDNVFILSTFHAFEDELNVYATIRAFLILKNKYPFIYENLIQKTEKSPLQNSSLKKDIPNFGFLNINRYYVISIHENESKKSNATTTCYNLGYKQPLNNYWTCENNAHLIFINKNTIRNGGTYNNSNTIYNIADKKEAQIKYLFDGLIQTIVHERIHNYIANNMSLNSYLNYIRNDNSLIIGNNGDASTYTFIEEPIVTNTVNKLFQKYGGLSQEIMSYYTDLFNNTQLPNCRSYTKYDALKQKLKQLSEKVSENDERTIMTIDF